MHFFSFHVPAGEEKPLFGTKQSKFTSWGLWGCAPSLSAPRSSDEDSWSDGEQDPITVEQTWRGDPDSEADSIDSDQEDPLK